MRFAPIALAACLFASPAVAADDVKALKAEGVKIIMTYGETLKGALVTAMKAGGPVKAIEVCADQAPHIAEDLSVNGWTVGRTSHRIRNLSSLPDDYESRVMAEFLARIDAGEKADKLAKAEIVTENGKKVFRLTKAIPTADVCMNCHGAALKPEVAAALDKLYPADIARGFKAGDMRGIFTLKKAL